MQRFSFIQRARVPSVWHSGLRFAVAIVMTDLLVWWIYREGTPVVMGSFAVICLLYFLDYDGTTRERLVGYGAACAIGIMAITIGTLLATPLVLAVLGAFVVSFIFSYARVLRGYIARASVGLQGAFFLPLMADVSVGELPNMLSAWLIGSIVAIVAGMVIFPKQRSGIVKKLLAQWLAQASAITSSTTIITSSTLSSGVQTFTSRDLEATTAALDQVVRGQIVNPGMVGKRERAIAHMVGGAHWSIDAFQLLESTQRKQIRENEGQRLLSFSSQAFADAALTLEDHAPPKDIPNLAQERETDLKSLTDTSAIEVEQRYPIRLISIVAMRMLWLAGLARGLKYPAPDLGNDSDSSPISLLGLNFGWRSVWFTNAIRTGAMTAACVLLVRELGLNHGLWVVLAALSVTQVTFSANSSRSSALRMSLGAVAGVVVASLGTLLSFPHIAFVIMLPFLAFLAVVASQVGVFTAQFFYTPFALANLAAIEWTTDRGLELLRIENITLGAVVAAVFAIMIYPFGLVKQVTRQSALAVETSREYLEASIQVAQGMTNVGIRGLREASLRASTQLESTISADSLKPTLTQGQISEARIADNGSRERIVGGDACLDLARERAEQPSSAKVVDELAAWWRRSSLLGATNSSST